MALTMRHRCAVVARPVTRTCGIRRGRRSAFVQQAGIGAPRFRTDATLPPHEHVAPLDQPILATVRTTTFISRFAHE
jgi:hypothetical protein